MDAESVDSAERFVRAANGEIPLLKSESCEKFNFYRFEEHWSRPLNLIDWNFFSSLLALNSTLN